MDYEYPLDKGDTMKRIFRYNVNEKEVEREYNYIPVRYIIAILITVFEVAAMIGIVIALCIYVPYFYVLCYLTEIACVIKIIASDDNPDYKVPWLLFVMIQRMTHGDIRFTIITLKSVPSVTVLLSLLKAVQSEQLLSLL